MTGKIRKYKCFSAAPVGKKKQPLLQPEPCAQGDARGEHRGGTHPSRSREQQLIEVPGAECRKVGGWRVMRSEKLKKPRCGWAKHVLGGNRTTRVALHSTVQKMWFYREGFVVSVV
ncbi:hypothetical protein CEXT_627921 [Caerostris extrusa]|uniref:Uncharacterized protein n=1 Tax=Caerostris extrusa TaxID=172846 RepID=A0AAV4WEP3_CAEEX|nr:hypothetical protein CEXT_627921 [Caerostris extrusa]